MTCLNLQKGFLVDTLGPIPVQDAVQRVIAFCCSPRSGFLGYDLVGHVARETGRLAEIGPWSILLADALAGRVTIDNLHSFMLNLDEFAARINLIPDADLAALEHADLLSVMHFCKFGFSGVWAPKITKVGALVPAPSIPILDGYLALGFGYSEVGFSEGKQTRWRAIERVIEAIASGIADQTPAFTALRHQAEQRVPAVKLLSDVRLTDIILWTSQADRMERPRKKRNAWLEYKPGNPPSIDDVFWVASAPRSLA